LELVNISYDFSGFDISNICNILQNSKSDYDIKKKSLEQLTLLLFDCQNKRGKALFGEDQYLVSDVFTFCLDEILTAFKTTKTYLCENTSELPLAQVAFLDQCCKFLFYAYTFYADEPVVKQFFGKLKTFQSAQSNVQQLEKFETLINSLVFFTGNQVIRLHALRLLYLIVFNPFWLKVKVTKCPMHQSKT
jgi:hypothetical protein